MVLRVALVLAMAALLAAPTGGLAGAAAGATGSGNVIVLAPHHLRFGRVPVGTLVTMTALVVNRSRRTVLVAVEQFTVPDDFSPQQSESTCKLAADGGSSLAPGQSCSEVVLFSPIEFFAGRRERGTIPISATDPQSGALLELETLKLSGTGI